MTWLAWSALLVVQNAAFTWVSRARNSGSLAYHAAAAVSSNGVWFASQWLTVLAITRDLKTPGQVVAGALVYTASTTAGSVLMHWASMRYLEKGKRSVGNKPC